MRIIDLTETILDFPHTERKRKVQMDRLRKRSGYYNDDGTPTNKHPDMRPKEPNLKLVKDAEQFPSVKTYSVEELAKKHGVDAKTIRGQLAKGTKIEKEHTTDASVAREIALDHIAEYPDYYDRLEKVEETKPVSMTPHMFRKTAKGKAKRIARKYVPGYGKRAADEMGRDLAVAGNFDAEHGEKYNDEPVAHSGRILRKAGKKLRKIAGYDPEPFGEAAGVGKITSQNTTPDVKPGETGRQANKFNLKVDSKGTPKLLKP